MSESAVARGLRRIPGSLREAYARVAYHQQTLQTTVSIHRRQRAERALENLAPVIARMEREEQRTRVQPYRHVYQRREDPNFDIVWDGT